MASFDAATEAFIAKVADVPLDADKRHTDHAIKDALSLAKKVVNVTHDPKKAVSRALIGLTTKELLKEGAMPVLRLFALLNDHYSTAWHDWEPETIWTTLAREQGVTLDRELKDMVLALQLTVNSEAPLEHWHIFEKVGHAFNQNIVDFQILQPLELDEAAFTLSVLRTIRKAADPEDEVCGYVAAVARDAGVVYLPESLFPQRCQAALDNMNNNETLRELVKKSWPKHAGKDDDPLSIQIGRLREIQEYVSEQMGG